LTDLATNQLKVVSSGTQKEKQTGRPSKKGRMEERGLPRDTTRLKAESSLEIKVWNGGESVKS